MATLDKKETQNKPSFLDWWWNGTSHASKLPIPFIWTLAVIFYVFALPEIEAPYFPWIASSIAITFAALGILYMPYHTYKGLPDSYFQRIDKNKFK
jgi:hypothetical protein